MEIYFTQTFDLQKMIELKDLGKKLKSDFNPRLHPQSKVYKNLYKSNSNIFNLTKKESLIVRARFGIGFKQSYTLREIGNKIKLSSDRIRQIEARALRKLKHPINLKILKQYGDIIVL
tara:strand:+ start:185 stop:538 length:354 start_codon:yes stop_codon:yes gene_type:complete